MLITNKTLYQLCKKYGSQAKLWRQKFIGLLPEVNRRRLFEEKGFSSIFEFAAKLCGLTVEQVRLALNLEKRFSDKPVLKSMLENGEVSINKLARVVSIATPENEEELVEKIKILPKSALDTLVRDEKFAKNLELQNQNSGNISALKSGQENQHNQGQDGFNISNKNGIQITFIEAKSLPVQSRIVGQTLNFELSEDVIKELNELHAKSFDVNELLRKVLQHRREEIIQKKEEIAEEIHERARLVHNQNTGSSDSQLPKVKNPSRYIPVKVKKILHEEFGTKCAIKNCTKPAEQTHHTKRFALSQDHDPRFMARFCHDHHILAHSVDIKFHRSRELALAVV